MYNRGMNTKHSSTCNMAFGRKDPTCPRCQELMNGAPARKAWFTAKPKPAYNVKPHNCKESNCNIICTFGEW